MTKTTGYDSPDLISPRTPTRLRALRALRAFQAADAGDRAEAESRAIAALLEVGVEVNTGLATLDGSIFCVVVNDDSPDGTLVVARSSVVALDG